MYEFFSASLPLVGLNMMVGAMLAARDRQRQWAIAGIGAAALNVALNFIAIPYTQTRFGNGAIGAALVTSLTEVFLLVAGQLLLERGILNRRTYVTAAKCVVIGAVMGLLVWLANDLPLVLLIPLGTVVYVVGVLAARVLTRDDIAQVRSLLARRGAAPPPVPAD